MTDLTYSDLVHLKQDIEVRIAQIELGEHAYLGRDFEALQEYTRQTDKEKSELKNKLSRIKQEIQIRINNI